MWHLRQLCIVGISGFARGWSRVKEAGWHAGKRQTLRLLRDVFAAIRTMTWIPCTNGRAARPRLWNVGRPAIDFLGFPHIARQVIRPQPSATVTPLLTGGSIAWTMQLSFRL